MAGFIEAVVDILPIHGGAVRVRVLASNTDAFDRAIDHLDREHNADDLSLVSITGAMPDDVGFSDDEMDEYWPGRTIDYTYVADWAALFP